MSKRDKLFAGAQNSSSHLSKKVLGNKTYVETIEIKNISPNPYQPREEYNEEKLQLLGENIKEHGQDQPITIVSTKDGFTLVAGERRLRASKLVGMTTIKAIIVDYTDTQMQKKALWENIHREQLTTYEVFRALLKIMETEKISSVKELAAIVNMSQPQIYTILSLNKLDNKLLELYRVTKPIVAIQVMEKLSGLLHKNAIKYFNAIVKQKLSRAKAIEYIKTQEEHRNKPINTKPVLSSEVWGTSKVTKANYELKINRKVLSKDTDKKIQEKLKEIEELLK